MTSKKSPADELAEIMQRVLRREVTPEPAADEAPKRNVPAPNPHQGTSALGPSQAGQEAAARAMFVERS